MVLWEGQLVNQNNSKNNNTPRTIIIGVPSSYLEFTKVVVLGVTKFFGPTMIRMEIIWSSPGS